MFSKEKGVDEVMCSFITLPVALHLLVTIELKSGWLMDSGEQKKYFDLTSSGTSLNPLSTITVGGARAAWWLSPAHTTAAAAEVIIAAAAAAVA